MSKAIDHGASITLTITPGSGFSIADVIRCEGQLSGGHGRIINIQKESLGVTARLVREDR